MVSDQEIAKGVEEILTSETQQPSLQNLNDMVAFLGHKLGFDLSHKSLFIRDQISLFFHHQQQQQQYHQHQHSQPPPPQPPQQPPPPQQHPVSLSGIRKDHFALQHQQHHPQQQQQQQQHAVVSQFQFNQQQQQQQAFMSQFQQQQQQHPRFALGQQQVVRQRHPVELSFGKAVQGVVGSGPLTVQTEMKGEMGVVQNVGKSIERPKKGGSAGTKRRGGPGGLNKLCGITPELQVIVGESALSRTDIVKQLWAYIKKNNLQDPGNKRKIICDDALRVVFETDCTDMFKMNKLLAKHIIRLEPTKESSRKKSKVNVEAAAESTDKVPGQVTQVIISEALANCLGTEEREMSQSEALRLVWEYIKVNNLEDPQNPVMILCDEKLKELFGCETISAMGIPELLVRHHLFKQ